MNKGDLLSVDADSSIVIPDFIVDPSQNSDYNSQGYGGKFGQFQNNQKNVAQIAKSGPQNYKFASPQVHISLQTQDNAKGGEQQQVGIVSIETQRPKFCTQCGW